MPADPAGLTDPADLRRRAAAELLGTALLVAVVVGSGIMGEQLAGPDVAMALLANTLATGAGLFAILTALGPISGAHLNPAVTVCMAWRGGLARRDVLPYVAAQVAGGVLGAIAAHGMFGKPALALSGHARAGAAQLLSEGIATFGLVVVIWAASRRRPGAIPAAVGAYITAAYWFTASTSFANPAVTVARSLTDTFSGIRPSDAPGFVLAQLVGAAAATALTAWLVPAPTAQPTAHEKERIE